MSKNEAGNTVINMGVNIIKNFYYTKFLIKNRGVAGIPAPVRHPLRYFLRVAGIPDISAPWEEHRGAPGQGNVLRSLASDWGCHCALHDQDSVVR